MGLREASTSKGPVGKAPVSQSEDNGLNGRHKVRTSEANREEQSPVTEEVVKQVKTNT